MSESIDNETKTTADIAAEISDTAQRIASYSDETKELVKLLCNNLCVDVHNYFVAMIERASKPESGFTAAQLASASKDMAKILATLEIIINRHKNFIIHGSPDFDELKTAQ